MKLLLTWPANSLEADAVRQELPPNISLAIPSPVADDGTRQIADLDEICSLARDADLVEGWAAPRVLVDAAQKLQFVAYLHHGIDNLPLAALASRGIAVANAGGAFSSPVADQALALLMACAKRILTNHAAVVEARWLPPGQGVELDGKTITVIGFGGIGRAIGKRARAFGMHVLAVVREPRAIPEADEVVGVEELEAALSRADFVVLAIPLTDATRGLINARALRAMRREAFLINIARGPIVDESAIYEALTTGLIAGYASDVWWDYANVMPSPQHFPVPSRLGVNRLPNVIGSGDRGGAGPESRLRAIKMGAQNVAAFARGERPPALVDLGRGY